mmetsp:Transcript_129154/g.306476  ORF Transcript_129154/g.306476 Transcript_129154/m.306476 type:complete len:214 (+) Transcript_129154:2876-3517(+)
MLLCIFVLAILLRQPGCHASFMHFLQQVSLLQELRNAPVVLADECHFCHLSSCVLDATLRRQDPFEVHLQIVFILLVILVKLPWQARDSDPEVAGSDVGLILDPHCSGDLVDTEPKNEAQPQQHLHKVENAKRRSDIADLLFRTRKHLTFGQRLVGQAVLSSFTTGPQVGRGECGHELVGKALPGKLWEVVQDGSSQREVQQWQRQEEQDDEK